MAIFIRAVTGRIASIAVSLLAGFAGCSILVLPLRGEEPHHASRSSSAVNFDRDVQPILASKCVHCHGPGGAEGGLRLDSRLSAIETLESDNHAIVPGKPNQSELMRRVTADEFERMPPEGEPLTPSEIDTLRAWIASGADWPEHWAYRPLERPAVPAFEDRPDRSELFSWSRTPVDSFILRQLIDNDLSPAPPADRRALIRRLSFDLLGLPPSPEEIDAFAADDAPDAYERLVDRMLASPHYGERWARHWMDVVQYADSHGFEHDLPREIWPYRDYLVGAFNRDEPYADFIRKQVAGDTLVHEYGEALAATGFLATGPWDMSAQQAGNANSIDRLIAQNQDRDDVVSTVMSTFVSSTVHCARCHDHKFDPISQADYYALQAVFAGIDKAHRSFDPDPAVAKKRASLETELAKIRNWRESRDRSLLAADIQAMTSDWEEMQREQAPRWQVLEPVEFRSANGSTLTKQPDGSLLSSGERPETDTYTVVTQTDLQNVAAVRLEVLTDESLPHQGPGRQDNGNLHLNAFSLTAAPVADPAASRPVELVRPTADFNQSGWSIERAIDNNPGTAWGIYPEVGAAHSALFEIDDRITGEGGTALTFELQQTHGGGHLIGRLRLSATDVPPSQLREFESPRPEVAVILDTAPDSRTDEQKILLAAACLESNTQSQLDALPAPQKLYCGTNRFEAVGGFRPADKPRPIHLLVRGEINDRGPEAQPASLQMVPDLPGSFQLDDPEDESARRAALADWLAHPKNVLTWRSIANRVWHFHFGRGLVDTPNDFGRMGSSPSHPELLDWLAVTLRDNGGSLKELHRLIVNSATYRQSSQYDPRAAQVDADNRLLWRMHRRRLDAESARDAMLKISGQLNSQLGGPPVKHFIETKTFNERPEADYQNFDVDDPANRRRSLYRFVYRTIPDPFLSALDCPDGTQLAPVRNVSITSLQALATLNDKFVIRQSEHIAERIGTHDDIPAQVKQAYRLILGRLPNEDELSLVVEYTHQHGLANACRFLLNTNEFMFLD